MQYDKIRSEGVDRMKKINAGICPLCETKLHINRLSCPQCKAEYPLDEELSPFDYLTSEQKDFLIVFLKCKGNIKSVEAELGISYPTVNKKYEELMISLGFKEKKQIEEELIDMSIFGKINTNSKKASDIIKNKLYENRGIATIILKNGDYCRIAVADNGDCFISDKLSTQSINFRVFDIIVDFLKEQGGKAPKGLGRGKEDKVGFGKCGEETIIYQIATQYYGKNEGESTFDPVFVLAAMLEWAGIAENGRGYIRLL